VMTRYPEDLQQRIQIAKERKCLTNKGKQMDELQIAEWINDLADGVDAIHELRITHRDLKPQNLFLDQKSRLRIGDFGISTQKTIASSLKGTIGYVAPEVWKGICTSRSDLWSVGCILLDLLTLTFTQEVMEMSTKKRMELIPKYYDAEWEKIVENLLKKKPTDRMDAKKLKMAVEKILEKIPKVYEKKAEEDNLQLIALKEKICS